MFALFLLFLGALLRGSGLFLLEALVGFLLR